jgi:hypothetical protein
MAAPIGNSYLSLSSLGDSGYLSAQISEEKKGASIEVAVKNIRKLSEGERPEKLQIKGDVVVLTFETGDNHQLMMGEVSLKKLSESIGKSQKEILESVARGDIDTVIRSAIESRKIFLQTPTPAISTEARAKIEGDLDSYRLTKGQFQQIELFYANNKARLDSYPRPLFIPKNAVDPPLAASLVYIPRGNSKGLYICTKIEVGIGAHNIAKVAVCVDTGKKAIWRTGAKKGLGPMEREISEMVSKYPQFFVGGITVFYFGPYRERAREQANAPKSHLVREERIEKAGVIMDYIEGGTLSDRIYQGPPMTRKEKVRMALEYAKALQCLQKELGIVQRDLKLTNTFLAQGHPLIADFGLAVERGMTIGFDGTPGYIATEVIEKELADEKYIADFPADIWSFGVILSQLFYKDKWISNSGQKDASDLLKLVKMSTTEMDAFNKGYFPNSSNLFHEDYLICWCLSRDPTQRPDIDVVVSMLENLESTNLSE